MGVTGDLLHRILKTAGRKLDLSVYKDGIIDIDSTPTNETKRQRTCTRRPIRIGFDVGTLVARAAHGFGSMLLDERHLTNYGRSLLHEEATAGADPRQQMTTEENRLEYVERCTGYVIKRITALRDASGAQLLVVFDGATPPIKEKECLERSDKRKEAAKERDEPLDADEEARVNSKRRVRAARRAGAGNNHNDIIVEVMKALRREQIPFLVAPYEADGQLAYFQSVKGMIDLVVTEDSDLIAHGCHSILYKTCEEPGNVSGILVQRGDLSAKGLVPKCLSLVDFSDVMLAVMFVALGCDYCSSLRQIGSVAARDTVSLAFHGEKRQSEEERKRPALEKVFEELYKKTSENNLTDEFKKEYEASFLAALLMYRHPMIYEPFLGKCVLLRNPPHGSDPELMDYKPYADLCSDVRRREQILGKCHGPITSTRIAEGWVNPRTKRPYENMAIPSTATDPILSLSASDTDAEDEVNVQTQDMPSRPALCGTEAAVEGPQTQDNNHVETRLGTPSSAQHRTERRSVVYQVEGPETLYDSRFETQPGTQDLWPPSASLEETDQSYKKKTGDLHMTTFTVTFKSQQLGLGLSQVSNGLCVKRVGDEKLERTLKVGDMLFAINGVRVGRDSLEDVVKRFQTLPRPLIVEFSRTVYAIDDDDAQDDTSTDAVVDLAQDSPDVRAAGQGAKSIARSPAVETTQTSSSSASRLASQPSQPSVGSQISAEVRSPNLLSSQPSQTVNDAWDSSNYL